MRDGLRSILSGTAGLLGIALLALVFTLTRAPVSRDRLSRERAVHLFSLGLAVQCLHFTEEFVTGFQHRWPALLGLSNWSNNFFVSFNLLWLSIWILSAVGLQRGIRRSLFPAWFFAMASMANGIAHPVLALITGGYFPGLLSSPLLGALGVMLSRRLLILTRSSQKS